MSGMPTKKSPPELRFFVLLELEIPKTWYQVGPYQLSRVITAFIVVITPVIPIYKAIYKIYDSI